ncbi:hypothetical protein TREMEDRAFT_58922 [Tremella mesenterica DSM 1558]|uniref:uncharacterized protein n=1 Tax=Tremella mesenterica (strain ATCC 24925 / CBS 8224 / DSM 1558 / NBRC 9311 / NRRL Y-6157 / RJB 2259-6 / UBC 559-6) TaxID=578456 RepID=UPI0003F4A0AB|nr:uncharacterized protein TREMEDRAFT_58922 [Tremella mesenterica DSM 1558]EIW72755.1 hypothetical protein TREMEDRAFT_58922 [Tremella mesenterica DSM 1558]
MSHDRSTTIGLESVPVLLSQSNCFDWKLAIENYLLIHGCLGIIKGTDVKPYRQPTIALTVQAGSVWGVVVSLRQGTRRGTTANFAVFSARRGYRDKSSLGSRNFAVAGLSGLSGAFSWLLPVDLIQSRTSIFCLRVALRLEGLARTHLDFGSAAQVSQTGKHKGLPWELRGLVSGSWTLVTALGAEGSRGWVRTN